MIVARHTVVKVFFAAVTVNAVIYIPVVRICRFDRLAHVAAVFIAGVLPNARKLVTAPYGFYKPPVKVVKIFLALYLYELVRE